jgi:uncharacterized protein DUF4112
MTRPARVISVDASGNVQSVEAIDIKATRERLAWLAWLLDSSIPIPGTRWTIGLDALIGLFPVLGDLLGVIVSSYIVSEAARLGAPKILLLRMTINIGLDGILGAIPFAGDIFDAAWKANQRNVRLLDAWLDRPSKAERTTRLFGALLLLALVALFVLFVVAGWLLVGWLIGVASASTRM